MHIFSFGSSSNTSSNAQQASSTTPHETENYTDTQPEIPSLRVEILSNNGKEFVICPPNSRTPIPFETDIFKGVALIVLKTNPIDRHFSSFFTGGRLFEVQVQGKFKRLPTGELYCGTEASKKMDLGIITRSISNATLAFCGTMVNDLHYSFGDNMTEKDYELPHLVAPFFPAIGKAMVTPPGETPPPMGIPFEEDLNYRKQRFKFKSVADVNIDLENTYSFSVNTSQLDMVSWTLKGVPMVQPVPLKMFFNDAAIRLVAYEIPEDKASVFGSCHPHHIMNYIFNMSLTPIFPSEDQKMPQNESRERSLSKSFFGYFDSSTKTETTNESETNESGK